MTTVKIYAGVYTTLLRGALPANVVQRNIVLVPAACRARCGIGMYYATPET